MLRRRYCTVVSRRRPSPRPCRGTSARNLTNARRITTTSRSIASGRRAWHVRAYSSGMAPDITLSTEVADALQSNAPIVALESTLITHGLPWPANAETALAMERAVGEPGACPGPVAVLGGAISGGVSSGDIERLASRPFGSVRKCSRRDLAIAVARREDASTTVAGTMIVAHQAGIRVFGTGGIGGVHRGAPFDVSADLIELGGTPIAVACGGAKSILDLPATLEVLETQGVPVVGLGTDTLPGFYARSSGLPIDVRVETPEEAAAIVDGAARPC